MTKPPDQVDGACEAVLVHGTQVAALRPRLPEAQALQVEAERFRALGDPTRLKILIALALSELCVCDLASLAGVTQTSASQHLKVLRAYDFVRYRKQGRMAVYRLSEPSLVQTLHRLIPGAQAGETHARRSG